MRIRFWDIDDHFNWSSIKYNLQMRKYTLKANRTKSFFCTDETKFNLDLDLNSPTSHKSGKIMPDRSSCLKNSLKLIIQENVGHKTISLRK